MTYPFVKAGARTIRLGLVALMMSLSLAMVGCDSPVTPKPTRAVVSPTGTPDTSPGQVDKAVALVSSPDAVILEAADKPGAFYLSTTPSGRLHWKVTAKPAWLSVTPREGDIDHNIVEIKVQFDHAADNGGGFRAGEVEIISNGGSAAVKVQGEIGGVANTGTATPPEGTGQTTTPVAPTAPPPTPTPTTQAIPAGEASVDHIEFSGSATSASFTLSNTGTTGFDWLVANSDAWMSTQPQSGSLAPGAQVKIRVNKDSSKITSGYADGFLTISSVPPGVDIKLPVSAASTDMWVLDQRVVDAEYNPTSDVIVTISADPSQLNIIHPTTKKVERVLLPAPPNCVSVEPDGKYAAVGHNAHLSYVNLTTKKVERTYDLSTDAIDIVLPGNGHVYAFPRTDQWETVRNIDLKTGNESLDAGQIYAGMLARLHPSGNFIYGADNGLSPSDIHKFGIGSDGKLTNLRDSPYHGDYAMNGNLWFSEDGSRIFVKGGNVFRSSSAAGQDMIYAGQLEGAFGLRWVATSTKAKRVFALDGGGYTHPQAPGLRVYDTDYLAFKGTVDLPTFKRPIEPKNVESQGMYVFVSADSSRVYVLLNADTGFNIDKDWALTTFDMAKMP